MLTPITGRARSGKSALLYRLIDERGSAGRRCLFIVPEQFSFEAEKLVLQNCSAEAAANTDVCSFSRLADKLIEKYEPGHTPYISDRGRVMLMNLALDDLWDRLSVYGKVRNRRRLASELITADIELKQACISPEALGALELDAENEALSKKLKDLSLILGVYNAQLIRGYSDRKSNLPRASELFASHSEEHDICVFIDEFSGFTADELTLTERLIEYCPEVFVTFCADPENPNDISFALPRKSCVDVTALAKKNNIRIAPTVRLTESYYGSDELSYLENDLFDTEQFPYEGARSDVTVCRCGCVTEECEFAALTAKKLIYEKGWRCRDIAVIERGDAYSADLASAFARYGLPVFRDFRRSIAWEGAAAYILAFAENALSSISTDAILRMLRSGMTEYDADEINQLDNYLLTFDIDGAEWKREWKYNPRGFGDEMSDDASALLERLNEMRETVVSSFASFRARIKGKNSGEILRALYSRLLAVNAGEKTKKTASILSSEGKNDEAQTAIAAYNELIECFTDMFDALGERYLDPKRFFGLFAETVGNTAVGVAPQELDAVTVGSADRIRLTDKKAVIVVGVTEGVFPLSVKAKGVFSDSERRTIAEAGAEISGDSDFLAERERFICYRAFSHASEKLYITYAMKNTAQDRLEPSEIIESLKKILPANAFIEFSDVPVRYRAAGRESAFRYLASHWLSTESSVSALIAYFNANGGADRMSGIDRLARRSMPRLSEASAKALYGDTVMITPSKIESYYGCRFAYFCSYGMLAQQRRRAELTPANNGSAVHYVLECVFNEYGSAGVAAMSENDRRAAVRRYLKIYADRFMTGLAEKSRRMKYIVDSYGDVINVVLRRISEEFAGAGFVTADTELPIGMSGDAGGLPPYFVRDLSGGTIGVRGKVDRVDLFRRGEDVYLRVVDYKTNSKQFRFGDVPNGFNLQMLVYLMALWDGGRRRYGGRILPAGVLYVPAELGEISNTRGGSFDSRTRKNGKMSGILLDDPISLAAMKADEEENYLPARLRDGIAEGSVLSEFQFENLHRLIDCKIAEMGAGLRSGDILPDPVFDGQDSPCEYCVYRGACLRDLNECARKPVTYTDREMELILITEGASDNE